MPSHTETGVAKWKKPWREDTILPRSWRWCLQGMVRDNTKMIDESGDLHVTWILEGLNPLYGVLMTFHSLNTANLPVPTIIVWCRSWSSYGNLANLHWVVAQHGDLAICLVTEWLKRRNDDHCMLDQYLKHQIPDTECQIYAAHQKEFVLWHNLLYLKTIPNRSNEDVLVFVVPGLKYQVSIDGCHQYFGHQDRDHTLSLLREILVAGHGPKDEDECPQLRKVPYLWGQASDTLYGVQHLYRTSGPGAHWLCVHGSDNRH